MKYLTKALKLIGFVLILSMASIGLGFNAALLPSFKREEKNESTIELVESQEESENQNQQKI